MRYRGWRICVVLGILSTGGSRFIGITSTACADSNLDGLGVTTLRSELGSAIPNGAGVTVAHVEASNGVGYFASDVANPSSGLFIGKKFTFITASSNPSIAISSHAQTVGQGFYSKDYSPA